MVRPSGMLKKRWWSQLWALRYRGVGVLQWGSAAARRGTRGALAVRLTCAVGLLALSAILRAIIPVAAAAPPDRPVCTIFTPIGSCRPAVSLRAGVPATDLSKQRWIAFDRQSGVTQLMFGTWIVAEMRSAWGRGIPGSDSDFYATAPGIYQVYTKRSPLTYNAWFDTYMEAWVAFDPVRFNGFHSLLKDDRGRVTDARTGPISAGCIRNMYAWEVYDFAEIGMPVVVHEGNLPAAAAALGHTTPGPAPGHDDLFGGFPWTFCAQDPSEPVCD